MHIYFHMYLYDPFCGSFSPFVSVILLPCVKCPPCTSSTLLINEYCRSPPRETRMVASKS